jgi:hypothetical protein
VEIKYRNRRWEAFRDLARQLGLGFININSNDRDDMFEEIVKALNTAIENIESTYKGSGLE